MSQWGSALSRRTLLQASGATLAAGSLGALAGCNKGSASGGGTSSTALKMLLFGDQKGADKLQAALGPQVAKLDSKLTLNVSAVGGTDWNDFFSKVLTQIASGTPAGHRRRWRPRACSCSPPRAWRSAGRLRQEGHGRR